MDYLDLIDYKEGEMKMISFENIKKANESIKTTDIKGKDYAEVNQRIKAFRMVYPTGTIETALIKCEDGICIMRAEVMIKEDNSMRVLGTGTAYEKENSSFINKTSYIENCETSAVGRALGMAGFGIDTSVASFEEIANAIQQQDDDKLISKTQAEALEESIKNNMLDVNETDKEVLKEFGYNEVKEIKVKDYGKIVSKFKEIIGD